MLMHNPTVGTFAGFIVEPTDVLTMEDIILTPMEAMEAMEAIIVRTNFGPHGRHMRRV